MWLTNLLDERQLKYLENMRPYNDATEIQTHWITKDKCIKILETYNLLRLNHEKKKVGKDDKYRN